MKLSASNLSHCINTVDAKAKELEEHIELLEQRMNYMIDAVDNLKEIVEQALLKANPAFKNVKAMKDVDIFLRNRIGRTRATKPN